MKPFARGYSHQIAFFISVCACVLLIAHSHGFRAKIINLIYCFSLITMYGMSTLLHRFTWEHTQYLLLQRIDHSAIFILIAGTATPICLLGLNNQVGLHLLIIFWLFAFIGVSATIFWIHSPKWLRSFFYVVFGWIGILYFPVLSSSLGVLDLWLLIIGGMIYTLGACVYALKRPNPFPHVFGYHEIFHILVIIASAFHFVLIYQLTNRILYNSQSI